MDSQQVLLVSPQVVSLSTLPSQMQQQLPPKCAICGTTQKLLRCAKCKTIYYCSTEHQHTDWPTHKLECKQMAKQRQTNSRLQQLTNGCSAININSNSSPLNPPMPSSSSSSSHNWPANYPSGNLHYMHNNDASIILGTNENEIMHSKAESVTQNSNSSEYMGNLVANSTTSDQMHIMQVGDMQTYNTGMVDNNQFMDNSYYYQNMVPQQPSPDQQQTHMAVSNNPQQPIPQFSNHLINQHEKSSSYQIGAAVVGDNLMENANERRYEELCRNIINDMNQYGLSVVDDFLGREKGMQILNEVLKMYSAGVFKDGQLVNNLKSEQDLRTIRGDKITWVKGVEPGCSNVGFLINQIDAVICRANAMRNNGKLGNYVIKERTKAMVACYPGSGSHYVMHVDNPNKDGRVITAIYYLNLNWDSRDSGGVLRIFPEQAKSVADIEPKFDRLIFFWSDKRNPHEVQPAHRTRYAITVWYFDANEREAALNRCKSSQNSSNKITNNTSSSSTSAASTTPANTSTSSSSASTANITNSNNSSHYADNTAHNCSSSTSTSASSANFATSERDTTILASSNTAPTLNAKPIQVVLPNCYK